MSNKSPSHKIKKHYDKIKSEIQRHNRLYHAYDRPEISDFEYDKLYSELLKIEKNYPSLVDGTSPSQRVGDKPLDQFEKANHRVVMLSLQNSYSIDELEAFDLRLKKFMKSEEEIEYFCEPKFDGLAIELIYQKGQLTGALTRGDGVTGENVISNVKTIRSLPLILDTDKPPDLLEIRGEILIFKDDFKNLNEVQQERGELPFANPRNAAAGTIRQLDPQIAAYRPLRVYCYGLGEIHGKSFSKHSEIESYLNEVGLPVLNSKTKKSSLGRVRVCRGITEACEYYEENLKHRNNYPYEIDGIVVKVNSLKMQEELGTVARSPRWATAVKFPPEQGKTQIEKIVIQVGRTGALTPIALMKPVRVGGVTITNATLHNQSEIERKDIRPGDWVIIQRAGDVIPEVVSVLKDKRKKGVKKFDFPKKCPECGNLTHQPEGEMVSRCLNPICPAVVRESIKHFVSRRAMNIDGLGDRLVEALIEEKLVAGFSDLYKLKQNQLLSMERQGEKSVQNILQSLEKSKKTTLPRLIFALGIRFVGEQTAKTLAGEFGSLDKLMKTNYDQLVEIADIGPKVAQSVQNAFSNKSFQQEVQNLVRLGVSFEKPRSQGKKNSKISGKNFVITGSLPESRNAVKDKLEAAGANVLSSVSKKVDYVVVGAEAGSKLEKAKKLKLKLLDWEQLNELLSL